jgi:hypothetical protein
MIVTSKDEASRWALYCFLREHDVDLPRSEDFHAIGEIRSKDGVPTLMASVGYTHFCGRTCAMLVAAEGSNWITRDLLWASFDYPFNQCDMVQIFVSVARNNPKALKLDLHLGFEILTTVKDGKAPGVDLDVLFMKRENCRWLTKLRKAA